MKKQIRSVLLASAVAATTVLVGCAGPAPNYPPSIDNVEMLRKSGASAVKTGTVSVSPGMAGANQLALRANTMVSPIGAHYGDYIAAALRQELEMAKLYHPQSPTEITGTLLKNNVDAGISAASGQIEARFVVTNAGKVRFDKVKKIEHQWEGAFAGAVAIPLAANNYPVMVQKLVSSLVQDPDFISAIRN